MNKHTVVGLEGYGLYYLATRDEKSGLLVSLLPEHPVARLLKAAPDLLEACERLLSVQPTRCWCHETDDPPCEACEARAAIKKARGES